MAALVGASLLNLVDSVIREQERLPQDQRRGALVVVDEMQTIPGVEFESMLSELGKYGASFVLATQSLAKLDQLSPSMRHTLLGQRRLPGVFQVAGDDARELVWELNRERVSEEDIVSQPVHHCYVRATVGTERTPVFSMQRAASPSWASPSGPPKSASRRFDLPHARAPAGGAGDGAEAAAGPVPGRRRCAPQRQETQAAEAGRIAQAEAGGPSQPGVTRTQANEARQRGGQRARLAQPGAAARPARTGGALRLVAQRRLPRGRPRWSASGWSSRSRTPRS